MIDIAIIGAGKVGTNLGYALSRKGSRIAAISDKNLRSAQESREHIGQGEVTDDNSHAARLGTWIVLALPDDTIEKAAEELAGTDIEWGGKFVFHCSGLLTSESLKPLETKGALVASIHPVQSFPQKKPDPKVFSDIFIGLEGKREALKPAKKVARQLGSRYFVLDALNKPLYHTACSVASNSMATLLDVSTHLLKKAGLSESMAPRILLPLIQGTLQNVKKFDAGRALTGPVVRGDLQSVQKHLKALADEPEFRELYRKIAYQSLRIAKRENRLSDEKIRALEALLAGK